MVYEQYGIDRMFVERIKLKMKNPEVKERVKLIFQDVTKADLQDRVRVSKLLARCANMLEEKLTHQMANNIINFVIATKIDPNSTFHLIKLWGMVR